MFANLPNYLTFFSIGIFSAIFLSSIWLAKAIPKRKFLLILILLSLCQVSLIIDLNNLNSLFIDDDHPKFYSDTLEQAELLLEYGTPFGFNHSFQGGIPTSFYLQSCFLEFIPFLLLFGAEAGFQLMLAFFIILIPIALFLLVRELTKKEEIARIVSFIGTFQLGLWPYLGWGMTPTIVAIPLALFAIFFFIKYLYSKNHYLFCLLFFSALLIYTQLTMFAVTIFFFIIISVHKLFTKREFLRDLRKISIFIILNCITCLPYYYNFFHYFSYFGLLKANKGYFKFYGNEKGILAIASTALIHLKSFINIRKILFIILSFIFYFYLRRHNLKESFKLKNVVLFTLITLIFYYLSGLFKLRGFFTVKLGVFLPYLVVITSGMFFLIKTDRRVKAFAVIVLLLYVFNRYPLHSEPIATIKDVAGIDTTLPDFINENDFVLVENSVHLPLKHNTKDYARLKHSHWLTYLQKSVKAKFFSHRGDDQHPYNKFRNMYLVNGVYRNKLLKNISNARNFVKSLKSWGVNKICVWSKEAEQFFNRHSEFKRDRETQEYICYRAKYDISPEVKLANKKVAKLSKETPFSFVVDFENPDGIQNGVVNKNYFDFFKASDQNGNPVALNNSGRKISFMTKNTSQIRFTYQKNIHLNLLAIFALLAVLVFDLRRFQSRRKRP